jgi:protein-tyrosine phosphatase
MKVDGIYNVRDLGGYITQDGKRTAQGLLCRGGSLTPASVYPHDLTDEGKAYMSEVMGIKTEIDFRPPSEAGGHTESPIPGANLVYITIGGYADAFGGYAQGYKEFFSALAVKENYPIYYHCTGGADRTGTVSFLLNGLLGVSELECLQDYEITSFSIYNVRNSKNGPYADYFQKFRTQLETFAGNTLQEKVESYLLSIGLTGTEIANIKAIMYGEQ